MPTTSSPGGSRRGQVWRLRNWTIVLSTWLIMAVWLVVLTVGSRGDILLLYGAVLSGVVGTATFLIATAILATARKGQRRNYPTGKPTG